jgi:glucose-6-phosphate 1-dehydrogenase
MRTGAAPRSDVVVLFGASGDLARKKLLPSLYHLAGRGLLGVPVVGVAASAWDDERLRTAARSAVEATGESLDGATFAKVARALRYVAGDYRDPGLYDRLAQRLSGCHRPLHYLAIPPEFFETVVGGLARAGLTAGARVVVEKPFGRDLRSARELNTHLHAAFPEEAIFRIDHFLGKEPVENLFVFRFANEVLEPIWNRNHVACVQVTMAESFGVEGRGSFYDQVGAIRDVVQNHLLQVVALLAMEPPISVDPKALRDEKVKVLSAIQPLDPQDVVRGQYDGYRDEPGVAADSRVETYAALRLDVESWRWAGVPFILRAGKAMGTTVTEAIVEFRPPPRLLFAGTECPEPHPNQLRFRVKPDGRITLRMQSKVPGPRLESHPVDLAVTGAEAMGEGPAAYEQLLSDALDGDPSRFAREDAVEHAWRVVDPVIASAPPIHPYARGSWGPVEADEIARGCGGWQPYGEPSR